MNNKLRKSLFFILIISMFFTINTSFAASSKDDEELIEDALEDLLDYYEDDEEYSFREAIGLNYSSENLDKEIKSIAKNFELSDEEAASDYAGNIIGIIASGENPEDYDSEDHVELLVDSQEKSGKFIVNAGDDHPATLAWSIIALDMAEAKYDEEDAITALLDEQNKDGGFTSNPDVDTAAMVITALANHKDIDGVEDAIDEALEFIKSNQLDSGGFPFMGSDNPYSVSCVIQALIANDIDPLSEEWHENGNSLLDALLDFKEDDHFEYKTKWGSETNSATEQAFIALADLYRGESMYQNVEIYEDDSDEEEEQNGELSLDIYQDGKFRNGEEAKIEVEIENDTDEDQEVTLIIALYDIDDDEMINYTHITRTIQEDNEETVAAGFLIPRKGDHEVRVFLWDNLDDMNILADPIYLDVK
ncbi:prenyltransferase/squalene oxidase repeat-containing protein [Wukongibacter baidiensis]|uniref:prenyltransferase/squalene oxidase repeat-containing protein n=1 Tax=Wukongibacter baidiensis TaxID=1723361 RepID=UPI003D7F7418